MRVGIDPGISGAIAFLDSDLTLIKVIDMPTMPLGDGNKQQINGPALVKILMEAPDKTPVFIEKVHVIAKRKGPDGKTEGNTQGSVSMFNFGKAAGAPEYICNGLFLPVHLVTPQSWKKKAGLIGKEKDMARTLAQQLYPEAELSRKKDIGRSDAILIARFGS